MKHTKGEWKVRVNEKPSMFNTLEIETTDFNYSGRSICQLDTDNNQAQANAKLIAAAPDMLKALKDLKDAAMQVGITEWWQKHSEVVAKASEAINKATD